MENRTQNIIVGTRYQALMRALDFMPCEMREDEKSSERAGYPVYRGNGLENFYNIICDLGDHFEASVGAKSINTWIREADTVQDETEKPPIHFTAEQLALILESLNSRLDEEVNEIANAGPGEHCNRLIRKSNQLLDLINAVKEAC